MQTPSGRFRYFVYVIKNKITGKEYVGVTTLTPEERFKVHVATAQGIHKSRYKNQPYFYRSLIKYGAKAWKIRVVHSGCATKAGISKNERKFIAQLGTYAPGGYNTTLGGEGTFGYKMSDEAKQKLRELRLGTKHKSSTLRKMRESRKGMVFTKATRMKMSESQLGEKNHQFGKKKPEHIKRKLSKMLSGENNPFFGKKHSAKTIAKLKKSIKPRYGSANSASRPVSINKVRYETVKDACLALNITRFAFMKLIDKTPGWRFIKKRRAK